MYLNIFHFRVAHTLISKFILNKNLTNSLNFNTFNSLYFLSTANMNFYKNIYYYYYLFLSFKIIGFCKKIINLSFSFIKTLDYFQSQIIFLYFMNFCKFFFMKYPIFRYNFL